MSAESFLTPRQIVAELDKYIIGQAAAKKYVAIALRNRWRRMQAEPEMQREISPNNILMIGPTGVGKTEIARRLAKLANAPFVKVEASKFTEVGYVGRDVESMVRDLAEQAVSMIRSQRKEAVKEQAGQLVEDAILDALIPPMRKGKSDMATVGFASSDEELNEKTRQRFREKLRAGDMEDRKIEVTVDGTPSPVGVVGGAVDEVSMNNIQEMISGMMPKKQKKRKVTIAEARKLLLEEESAKLIDMDEVKEEALKRAANAGIIFIDEIDKVAVSSSGGGKGPDVSREGVQRDLLPIVEGSAVNTKYGMIQTDHILFIAAGAFHMAKPSDLIPELQGRLPIRVELDALSKDDFLQILKAPKNALTKQYQHLLQSEEVTLAFEDDALEELADLAFNINSEVENIGARRLHTVMSTLLSEIMFEVPDNITPGTNIQITRGMVQERVAPLVKNQDMSHYIL